MGTTGPWRTAFGSTQGACADHPPAGLGEPIIRGLFSVSAPFRDDVNSAHIDPSPTPQGFALLGQALATLDWEPPHPHVNMRLPQCSQSLLLSISLVFHQARNLPV